jgi:hypothetical protein
MIGLCKRRDTGAPDRMIAELVMFLPVHTGPDLSLHRRGRMNNPNAATPQITSNSTRLDMRKTQAFTSWATMLHHRGVPLMGDLEIPPIAFAESPLSS